MNAPVTYRTISDTSEGMYKEKGSKFISLLYPAASEEEVHEILSDVQRTYHDARHHCYAYILDYEEQRFRTNDDGEPNHSAGDPILGQLRSHQLCDVVCIVVRYFGGTKLGVSGLIHAYRTAAEEAIKHGKIVVRGVERMLRIRYSYDATNEIMRLSDEFNLTIYDQDFKVECLLTAGLNVGFLEAFKEKCNLLQSTGTDMNWEFIDTPS
jgi:uncharacterized YigZ family protein